MDLKEGHIMHEQMYPSFLNTDREADCECPLYRTAAIIKRSYYDD